MSTSRSAPADQHRSSSSMQNDRALGTSCSGSLSGENQVASYVVRVR